MLSASLPLARSSVMCPASNWPCPTLANLTVLASKFSCISASAAKGVRADRSGMLSRSSASDARFAVIFALFDALAGVKLSAPCKMDRSKVSFASGDDRPLLSVTGPCRAKLRNSRFCSFGLWFSHCKRTGAFLVLASSEPIKLLCSNKVPSSLTWLPNGPAASKCKLGTASFLSSKLR